MLPFGHQGSASVVLALAGDVAADRRELARADGGGAVGGLPFEGLAGPEVVRDEVRRGAFDVLDQFRDTQRGRQPDQQMDGSSTPPIASTCTPKS